MNSRDIQTVHFDTGFTFIIISKLSTLIFPLPTIQRLHSIFRINRIPQKFGLIDIFEFFNRIELNLRLRLGLRTISGANSSRLSREDEQVNIKHIAIGSVAGAITLVVVGIITWDVIFADFFAANSMAPTGFWRDTEIIWAVVVGVLSYSVFITLAIQSRPASPKIMDGLRIGAIVGFLMWFSADFVIYGLANVWNLTATIADILLETFRAAISGAIIAAVLGKLKRVD